MNTPLLLAIAPGKIIAGAITAAVVLILLAVAVFKNRKRAPRKSARASAPASGSGEFVEIYVGNLSYEMGDEQLRAAFAKYGVVQSARVITHRPSGKSKGYGFVEMPHRAEAEIAIKAINNTDVMGRRIRCNEARANTRPED